MLRGRRESGRSEGGRRDGDGGRERSGGSVSAAGRVGASSPNSPEGGRTVLAAWDTRPGGERVAAPGRRSDGGGGSIPLDRSSPEPMFDIIAGFFQRGQRLTGAQGPYATGTAKESPPGLVRRPGVGRKTAARGPRAPAVRGGRGGSHGGSAGVPSQLLQPRAARVRRRQRGMQTRSSSQAVRRLAVIASWVFTLGNQRHSLRMEMRITDDDAPS